MEILEGRFEWIVTIATSMTNLGYAPAPVETGQPSPPNEANLILGILELIDYVNQRE